MQKNMRIVFFLVFQAILFSMTIASNSCGENEEYNDCGTACPRTCQNRNDPPKPCTEQCVKGCFCKANYIRDTSTGKCVTEDHCPKDICGENEEYNDCGTACPRTCQNRNDPPKPCTKQCVKGCFCKDNYIRDTSTGKCVTEDHCPKAIKCGKNEEEVECENPCQPTCDDPNKLPCPTFVCNRGCHCKPGFLRDPSGKCIPKEDCPKPKCGCHEVYTDCGSYCPPTCQNQNPGPCILLCKPGCFCKKKYIRDKITGRCIKKEDCPK